MEAWQALLLGVVQGLTEFLPVSSSGHLVVIQALMAIPQPLLISFDIAVHWGSLVAVVLYFRRDLQQLVVGLWHRQKPAWHLGGLLVIGSIPALVLGLLARDYFATLFGNAWATGWQLLANGIILLVADRFSGRRTTQELKNAEAGLIGLGQAAAIIPGISRSGATMALGLGLRLTRAEAARFAFLLAIPAIGGAGLLDLPSLWNGSYQLIGAGPFWLGTVGAAVAAYLVIRYFLAFLAHGRLRGFGYYCILLGVAVLAWFWH